MVVELTPADDYSYTISDELQKMAATELRESISTIEQSLKTLRDWARQNPRIATIRMDASFFLRFLRAKKYSIPMVQESIERYLLLRDVNDGDVFKNMDHTLPNLTDLLRLGYIFALPNRDEFGRRVLMYRPGVFDPSKFPNTDLLKMHGIVYETLMEDEENQIRGMVHIVDASGVGFAHLTLFTPKEALRLVKNGEKTIPMRHKSINAINIHPSLKFAVDFGLAIVSEKMKKRVHFFTSMDSTEGVIDKKMLPKEYGGTMPMSEMIALFMQEVTASRETLLRNDKMGVKLEMYTDKAREGAVSALKQQLGCSNDNDPSVYGMQGSFRKLQVD